MSSPATHTPLARTERALAPDLARGVMLLAIVLANTPGYLYASSFEPWAPHPAPELLWDSLTQLVLITAVSGSVYPMYSFLVGYGLVMLHRRQAARGTPPGKILGIVTRRSLVMFALGLLHAMLLFAGDIAGLYGLLGLLIAALLLNRSTTTIMVMTWVTAGVLAVILVLGAVLVALFPVDASEFAEPEIMDPSIALTSWAAGILPRLALWGLQFPALLLLPTVPAAMIAGMWASRVQLLEQPARHRRTLLLLTVLGIVVGWGVGLPLALQHLGWVELPSVLVDVLDMADMGTGVLCGIGYAAGFALLAQWITGRSGATDRSPGLLVDVPAAVGRRSLSCYLAQSVLCAPVLAAWGLGLGAHLTSATMALYAIAVWVVIALGAYALDRAGRQGPAEWLVRRLAYPHRR